MLLCAQPAGAGTRCTEYRGRTRCAPSDIRPAEADRRGAWVPMKTRPARGLTAGQLGARLERLRGVRVPAVPRPPRSRVAGGVRRGRLSRLDAGRGPFLARLD